jgi:hypothetical protein
MKFRLMQTLRYVRLALICIIFASCDQGLSPQAPGQQTPPYGISGTIHFRNWPPADSIVDLRVVSFKNYPAGDIFNEVLQGRAGYTSTLQPYGADSVSYTLILSPIPTGPFAYTVVAQRYGQNINTDWRAVGEFHAAGDTLHPGVIVVPADSIVPGINIDVDFNHPPPPPQP